MTMTSTGKTSSPRLKMTSMRGVTPSRQRIIPRTKKGWLPSGNGCAHWDKEVPMKPIILRLTPRARRGVEKCVGFGASFSGGKREERRRDIHAGFDQICEFPQRHPVEVRRRRSGLELRRHHVRQFTIVYAYFPPDKERPWAIVTVRAVQHRRIRNVFFGV